MINSKDPLSSKNTIHLITVIKRNPQGRETWRYQGNIKARGADYIVLEAYFDREDRQFHGMPLCKGDRFLETYYTDRWYNVYEVHSRDDDALRGWYCNVGKPAIIEGETLSYIDLALDLLIFPDGRQVVLDEDEFEALDLSAQERQQAIDALDGLKASFAKQLEIRKQA
jgi:predicted RNA-binding protein associated with RNAse of E/G family